MKTLSVLSLLVIMTFVFSCDVSEDDAALTPGVQNNSNNNNSDILKDGIVEATDSTVFRDLLADSVSKVWEASSFTLGGSTAFTSCRLDDVFTFFSDGTYAYSGGRLCGAEDTQQNRNGSWELDYTAKKIYFDRGTSNEYVAEVKTLNENELGVEGSYMRMTVQAIYSRK